MLVLGLNGGLVMPHEDNYRFQMGMFHDSSASLLSDGEVVAASEEERFSRYKHTPKFPYHAIRFCLGSRGLRLADVDYVAFAGHEDYLNREFGGYLMFEKERPVQTVQERILELLEKTTGEALDPAKLRFVPHHRCHAMSAFAQSGFDEALVFSTDAGGDDDSGLLSIASRKHWQDLEVIDENNSTGRFYIRVIRYLGFDVRDEYKVMGLAPYGQPDRFRDLISSCYSLLPDGRFQIRLGAIGEFSKSMKPRRKYEPVEQWHKDLAASLQRGLEEIYFHVLKHQAAKTGQRSLCLTGGVAHNCTMNGKILASGLYDRVFVQPAAHDAGCGLGAALQVGVDEGKKWPKPIQHIFWGTAVPEDPEPDLARWSAYVSYERMATPVATTAKLLANNQVIGWVQGRSEFGPRALGNRSILADPRPFANRERINGMVKKREGFRPFAPAVKFEALREYFEAHPNTAPTQFAFMTFITQVREEKRSTLGAVTHVDGSARVQSVSKDGNPKFWELLEEFGKLTGVPILLNTSFNNNREPIIDSVDDAVVCFLTTQIDCLVAGDYLVKKKAVDDALWGQAVPSLPAHVRLVHKRSQGPKDLVDEFTLQTSQTDWLPWSLPISREAHALLAHADGKTSIHTLAERHGVAARAKGELIQELVRLWGDRAIILRPAR